MPRGPTALARVPRRSNWWTLAVILIAGVSLLSLLAAPLLGGNAAAPARGASGTPAPALAVAPAAVTHGDLNVPTGTTYTISPALGSALYYQGGNITVSGTLYITDVTVSFVQYIAPSGTAAQRLDHLYHFIDRGKVIVTDSTITTDMSSVNAYAKLNLTVEGGALLSLSGSTLAFPGWLTVTGAGTNLTLADGSAITANPAVSQVVEPAILKGDNAFAPTLLISKGAAASFLQSRYADSYADNFSSNGTPRPATLASGKVTINGGGATNVVNNLTTSSTSANLSLDWAYPGRNITGGEVVVSYTDGNSEPTPAYVNITYGATTYFAGRLIFKNGTSAGEAIAKFPAALTAAINTGGLLQYLNYTGDFGVTPSKISVTFTAYGSATVKASSVAFLLNPGFSNNITVVGTNSRLTTADSRFDLTFNNLARNETSLLAPYPWDSNKLLVAGGATAYLANLSVTGDVAAVFRASAVGVTGTSNAYLFRWAEFNVTGLHGVLVNGGIATAHYAYTNPQVNNKTANNLNRNLSTVDPVLAGYVQAWDVDHGAPSYGESGVNGVATLLLASNWITANALPNGYFLGNYHITVNVPAIPDAGENSVSFIWSNVSSYPIGVAAATPGYGQPDHGPGVPFPAYYVLAAIPTDGIAFSANGTAATTVRIGQELGVAVTIEDEGTGPVTNVTVQLYYNSTVPTVLASVSKTVGLTTTGTETQVSLSWLVTDTITGLQYQTVDNSFKVRLTWNGGIPQDGGASTDYLQAEQVEPSQVKVTITSPAIPASLSASKTTRYAVTGTLLYNGSQEPTVDLYAQPEHSNGLVGQRILLTVVALPSPNASRVSQYMVWAGSFGTSKLARGVSYSIYLTASYNGVVANKSLGTHEVPAPSKPFFLFQKILGEELWVWLVITAAVVLGLIGFMLFSRRQAAGKVVECGECGSLIPETAKACPKCGAEFESDVVRCSRCSSTIPASSRFCPECAAQLLGKAGEAGSDPERQAYADFTERFRAEAKKDLGDNYSEGSFWDWWKRQSSYTPFSQWKLQQGQGTPRAGMSAPPPPSRPGGGAGGAAGAPAAAPPLGGLFGGGGAVMPVRAVPWPCWIFHWLNGVYDGWRFHQSQNAPSP